MARALLLLALLLVTGVAHGAKVVVIAPAEATSDTREAVTRTQAELSAEGFEVETVELAAGADPRAAIERTAAASGAAAAIAVFPTPDGATADVWVTDRITGKTSVRQVRVGQLPSEERPRALSIRAVELLRASLVEAVAPATRDQPRERVPYTVVSWLAPQSPPLSGFGAQLGVGLLASLDGVSPAGAPVVRLSYGGDHGFAGRLSWLGPAFGGRADTATVGGAAVRQEMLALELVYAPRVDWADFTPILSAGAGGYHLEAVGELLPPLVGRRAEVWAFAIAAGAGLGYRLTPNVMAVVDASAVITIPRAVVTIEGQSVGTTGRPSLTGSAGVVLRFE